MVNNYMLKVYIQHRGKQWTRTALLGLILWTLPLALLGPSSLPASGAIDTQTQTATPMPSRPPYKLPDHMWLARPVSPKAHSNHPDRFYPYGSTGHGQYQVHHGVEFVNPTGTPVLAVADGTIDFAGQDELQIWGRHPGYYGSLIILRLDRSNPESKKPIYVLYEHLSKVDVRTGQHVQQGEKIGAVGSSGVALGPHLHFEVRVGRNTFSHTRNPELWLKPLPGYGTIAGRIETQVSRPSRWVPRPQKSRLVEGDVPLQDLQGGPQPQVLVTVRLADQPDRHWREAWTYADVRQEQLHPDDVLHENLAMGDIPAGEYIVQARVNGQLYTRRVKVIEGQITWVSIVAEPTRYPRTAP